MQSRWFDYGGDTIIRTDQCVNDSESLMMDIVELTTAQIYPARQRSAFPRRLAILEDTAHRDELGGETALP